MDHEQQTEQQQTEAPGAERKARASRLRRRAFAVSAACFALFLGVITIRMAAGEDPVLGGGSSGESGEAAASATELPESSGEFTERDRFGAPPGEGPEGLFEEGGSESAPVMPESLHSGQS